MNFNNIKQLREENELTQKEMAEKLNTTRLAYSLWELGKNIIPLPKLLELSNMFKISMDYLCGLSTLKDIKYPHPTIDKKSIGKNLLQTRKKLKLTQEKLAKKFNTTHSAISSYENGITLIPTIFLIELSRISNKSIDWFCSNKINE